MVVVVVVVVRDVQVYCPLVAHCRPLGRLVPLVDSGGIRWGKGVGRGGAGRFVGLVSLTLGGRKRETTLGVQIFNIRGVLIFCYMFCEFCWHIKSLNVWILFSNIPQTCLTICYLPFNL